MRQQLRALFHWSYSQFFIAAFFGTAVAMMLAHSFWTAYTFFSLAGLWFLAHWQVSDFLIAKHKELQKAKRKHEEKPKQEKTLNAFTQAHRRYWFSNLAVSVIIVAITTGCLIWTHSGQIEYELSQLYGRLIPADDPDPPYTCSLQDDEMELLLGGTMVKASGFPIIVLLVSGKPVITLDRNPDDSLTLSVDVRSADGRLIAKLDENRFLVNPLNSVLMHRPDKSTLTVVDQNGDIALNARYVNRRVFALTGHLISGNRSIDLTKLPMHGVCLGVPNRGIAFRYAVGSLGSDGNACRSFRGTGGNDCRELSSPRALLQIYSGALLRP